MDEQTVVLPGGTSQTTKWLYGQGLQDQLVKEVRLPNPSTGEPSEQERELFGYNIFGQVVQSTDRNGTIHERRYDPVGRLIKDSVATTGTGIDDSVYRIELVYDTLSNPILLTSQGAGDTVVNQVRRRYDGYGRIVDEAQSHAGSVGANTPMVTYQYTTATTGGKSRFAGIVYPNGQAVLADYGAVGSLNDRVSRIAGLRDGITGDAIQEYTFLGFDTLVRDNRPQTQSSLTLIKQLGDPAIGVGDPRNGGDQYTGLDRFGRVVDQRWMKGADDTNLTLTRFVPKSSLVQTNENLVLTSHSTAFSNDGLDRLTSFKRGTLNAQKTDITTPTRQQSWDLDARGNWNSVTSNGNTEVRTHNLQDEITAAGTDALSYDPAGNLSIDDNEHVLVYDAWKRLVTVKTLGGTTLVSYSYDALGRRIIVTEGGQTTHLLHSATGEVLEERASTETGALRIRYLWSLASPGTMVLRERDTDLDGVLDERIGAQQNAGGHVTSLVDTNGNVIERFEYDPFGAFTVLDPDGTIDTDGSDFAWTHLYGGYRYDAVTGLYLLGTTDYSPTLGRTTQGNDPLSPPTIAEQKPLKPVPPTPLFDSNVPLDAVRRKGTGSELPNGAWELSAETQQILTEAAIESAKMYAAAIYGQFAVDNAPMIADAFTEWLTYHTEPLPGRPGDWDICPVYGSGSDFVAALENGRYCRAAVQGGLFILDLTLVGTIGSFAVKSAAKIGGKALGRYAARRMARDLGSKGIRPSNGLLARRSRADWFITRRQSRINKEAIMDVLENGNSFSRRLAADIGDRRVALRFRRLSDGTEALYQPMGWWQPRPVIYLDSSLAFQNSKGVHRAAVSVVHEGQHYYDDIARVINWENTAYLEMRAFLREAEFAESIGRQSYSVFGRIRTRNGNAEAMNFLRELYPGAFP